MKIKLAILDSDRNYLEKMHAAFIRRYSDKLEIYLFTSAFSALESLAASKIDVFLINKAVDLPAERIPSDCMYAYLSDVPGIERYNDKPVICKFQRMDMIFKQILDVYAMNRNVVLGSDYSDVKGKVILFFGAGGGMGTSSVAAGCAVRFAGKQKKVLYLNLQKLSGADMYFTGEGQRGMTDLILALQDSDASLRLQLQSWVREDTTGVCFFAQAKTALDMMELDAECTLRLLSELKKHSDYDYVILDADLTLDPESLEVYKVADEIVMVSDHSKEAAVKAQRALAALAVMEGETENPIAQRISVIYNKAVNENEVDITEPKLKSLGGVGVFKSEKSRKVPDNRKVVELLAGQEFFDKL